MNRYKTYEWGRTEEYLYEPGYCVNRIIVFPGKKIELRKHHKRAEVLTIAEGSGIMTLGDSVFKVKDCAVIDVPRHFAYSLENDSEYKPLVIIETQLGLCDENDIEFIQEAAQTVKDGHE